eukprot:TRINITY_DN14725_c0_g2_i1.p1 TRINITY_DN14725_c0_g2~~TRINITY_DN14725_c0_g2_i1.p1  ORF type:complete len:112 (+),score=16.62 TRINITY_DN14725_c0_g2_i1:24-338(+)
MCIRDSRRSGVSSEKPRDNNAYDPDKSLSRESGEIEVAKHDKSEKKKTKSRSRSRSRSKSRNRKRRKRRNSRSSSEESDESRKPLRSSSKIMKKTGSSKKTKRR